MTTVGYMPMPGDFKYADVLRKGRPKHDPSDPFLAKHPPMPAGRWAKIFAPFDALKGFSESIANTDASHLRNIEYS